MQSRNNVKIPYKNKIMIRKYLILSILLCALSVSAQVTVQFIPEINGRNLNGLFNCQLINMAIPREATITITVSERNAGAICFIRIPQFMLPSGVSGIPSSAAKSASIQFSNTNSGRLSGLNNAFPAGDYEYCYSVNFLNSDTQSDEQCFSYTLAPFSDLNLIDPYDQETITIKRPLLTWQPLLPGIPGAYYQLVLTEIKDKQNATEALNYNLPIINQLNIVSPILPYPSIARELENKKKYAWQVTAYKDQTILTRSEIWEFTVGVAEKEKKEVWDKSYRNVEDLSAGNYYVAHGELRLAIVNDYALQKLKYTITSITNIKAKFRRLPEVQLNSGSNFIVIDLQTTGYFENGHNYILTFNLANGTQKKLRFIYEDTQ